MSDLTARDEIRVSEFGLLRCPSCHELAAELIGHHNLIIMHRNVRMIPSTWKGYRTLLLEADQPWCECRDGERAFLASYQSYVAAANIALADQVWFTENRFYANIGLPLWNRREK